MAYIVVMNSIDEQELGPGLLRTFVALAEERHVTRAAARLGMTQSATSHALGRLRRALKDPLFVRAPKGVVATERALGLLPEVKDVLLRLDALGRPRGPFDPRTLTRTFVLGGADFAEVVVLPPLERVLGRLAPDVQLVSRPFPSRLDEELESGRLDVAMGVFRQTGSRLVIKKLFEERFVCLLRRAHPALKRPLTVERWAALRHVFISPRGEGGGVVDDALAERGLSRRVAVRTSSFLSAPLLVAESDCVLTVPSRIAEAMKVGRPLVLVPPPVKLPPFTMALAFHERSRQDPAHAWLREQIASAVT